MVNEKYRMIFVVYQRYQYDLTVKSSKIVLLINIINEKMMYDSSRIPKVSI